MNEEISGRHGRERHENDGTPSADGRGPVHRRWPVTVDGRDVAVRDRTPNGRQVRQDAGLSPASDFVLVLVVGRGTRSIGLDEPLDLADLDRPAFYSFPSGDIRSFTVDEIGWEWGADAIPVRTIREISAIPGDHEIVLDTPDGPRSMSDDGEVALSGRGAERLYSRVREKAVTIVVNGRARMVRGPKVSFEQLVALAFPVPPTGEGVQFTVQFTRGPAGRPTGTLVEGGTVKVQEGMEFDVTATNRS